jgi:hypothetical protein
MVFIVLSKYSELPLHSRDCSAEVYTGLLLSALPWKKEKNVPLAFTRIYQRLVCGHA